MRALAATPTCMAILLAASAPDARANEVYATDFAFPAYVSGNLNGQSAWTGPAGTWAVSGSVNSPYTAGSVIGAGVAPGVDPVGGTGQMVRLVSERFSAGRTRAYLDLANSGRWAAASAGGRTVLASRVKLFVPSGQPVASGWGIMISRTSAANAGGFLVNAQDGSIWALDGGYAPANRIPTGVSVPLNQWNDFTYAWDSATGAATLRVNGQVAYAHSTATFGSVFAANLLATTDSAPGPANAFGYFDDLRISAELPASACTADIDGDGSVGGPDLTALLAAWGSPGGSADLDGDGNVSGPDLTALLAAWGSCTP